LTLDASTHKLLAGLKATDPDLAYLAVLTCDGLKPLSRWERTLDAVALGYLQELGLIVEQIPRRVMTGKRVTETIFGMMPGLIDAYKHRFHSTVIDKSEATQQFEGFVFGYPGCCVTHFIQHAYAPNDLPQADQEILFHWACKDCQVTPTLLPAYRRVYKSIMEIDP
jgi:hypothetical protein